MNGKGSGQRPCRVGLKVFRDRWDRVFSKTKYATDTDKELLAGGGCPTPHYSSDLDLRFTPPRNHREG